MLVLTKEDITEPLVKALKKAHPEWSFTVFAHPNRSVEAVKAELGVARVANGEFGEFDKTKALSKEHEIVIHAGNSFALVEDGT